MAKSSPAAKTTPSTCSSGSSGRRTTSPQLGDVLKTTSFWVHGRQLLARTHRRRPFGGVVPPDDRSPKQQLHLRVTSSPVAPHLVGAGGRRLNRPLALGIAAVIDERAAGGVAAVAVHPKEARPVAVAVCARPWSPLEQGDQLSSTWSGRPRWRRRRPAFDQAAFR